MMQGQQVLESLEIKKLNIPKRKLNEFEATNLLSEFGINMNKCHLIKNKSEKPINPEQTFKDEFNSLKESFGQSFWLNEQRDCKKI